MSGRLACSIRTDLYFADVPIWPSRVGYAIVHISLVLRLFPDHGFSLVDQCLAVTDDIAETEGHCVVAYFTWNVWFVGTIIDNRTHHI